MFTCYRGLGESWYAEQDWQQANEAFRKALTYNPQSVTTYYYLGITYEAINDPANAVNAYDNFLQLAESQDEPTKEMAEMTADAKTRKDKMSKAARKKSK